MYTEQQALQQEREKTQKMENEAYLEQQASQQTTAAHSSTTATTKAIT